MQNTPREPLSGRQTYLEGIRTKKTHSRWKYQGKSTIQGQDRCRSLPVHMLYGNTPIANVTRATNAISIPPSACTNRSPVAY